MTFYQPAATIVDTGYQKKSGLGKYPLKNITTLAALFVAGVKILDAGKILFALIFAASVLV